MRHSHLAFSYSTTWYIQDWQLLRSCRHHLATLQSGFWHLRKPPPVLEKFRYRNCTDACAELGAFRSYSVESFQPVLRWSLHAAEQDRWMEVAWRYVSCLYGSGGTVCRPGRFQQRVELNESASDSRMVLITMLELSNYLGCALLIPAYCSR